MRLSRIHYLLIPFLVGCAPSNPDRILERYVDALKKFGVSPEEFVAEKLASHDLLIFDDAFHNSLEPWDFYNNFLSSTSASDINFVFVEALSYNFQPMIDKYIKGESDDIAQIFQNDYSGYGWSYQTLVDLLNTVRTINLSRLDGKALRVVGVAPPIYWNNIRSHEDLELFRMGLLSYDNTMYNVILDYMDKFESGKKGVFLTNSRHAYKGIRDSAGRMYWNCGTFFTSNYPGSTYSIRFHNASINFKPNENYNKATDETTEGLNRYHVSVERMETGLWDDAFAEVGDKPIALDIGNNIFGKAAYVGNHMIDAAANQTMWDAYDAIIFISPIELLRKSAVTNFYVDTPFKIELERRIRIMNSDTQLGEMLSSANVQTIRQYIDQKMQSAEVSISPYGKAIGSIDAWRKVEE